MVTPVRFGRPGRNAQKGETLGRRNAQKHPTLASNQFVTFVQIRIVVDHRGLDETKEAHEMSRDNLTWYLSDGRGGYRHVRELPPNHVLVDNECACLRPAASKADQTAQHF